MPVRPAARLGYVKCVRYITDTIIRVASVLSEVAALLLGFHFWITLHFIRFVASSPAVSGSASGSNRGEERERSQDLIRLRRAPGTRSPVHLTALDLHTLDGSGSGYPDQFSFSTLSRLLSAFQRVSDFLADALYVQIGKMVDRIEKHGGIASNILARMRRCESVVSGELIGRLPAEIVDHILLLAAMPDHIGGSGKNSTKIALLSRAHYRLVTPRLYANIHLTNAVSFRRFRMTLALHKPELGQHVRSLSVASSRFDAEGYLPDQVAEHITLGVGIEQILLASPHLQHLFLDLFSLAALHNGTGSRLEKGALPISLTTEFSMPQYLTLPTFLNLKHVELTVFGLDNNAVDWFRQVLPQLETLTLRWVSRRSSVRRVRGSSLDRDSSTHTPDGEAQSSDDEDYGEAERETWREGGRRRQDFLLFVEAIEILRRWPFYEDQEACGSRLEAVSIFAWPKAYRELHRHYSAREGVTLDAGSSVETGSERYWNASLRPLQVKEGHVGINEKDDKGALQALDVFSDNIASMSSTRLPSKSQASPLSPAPLRISLDPAYRLGPRRGALYDWYEQRKAAVWSK